MKVAIFETEQWEHEACLKLAPRHEVSCSRATLDEDSVAEHGDAEVISIFIYSSASEAVLARLPKLKLIVTRSAGYDHIDFRYCRAHGVHVAHVPDYGDSTVAEHVFALLLGLARHLVAAAERTRRGEFSHSGLRGFELFGKTFAVVGVGRIGKRVIEIARGFGMEVVAVDKRPDQRFADRLGFRYAPLPEALAAADVVTLHVPAAAGAAGLIGDAEFARMRPGATLINTARGAVVDIEALVRALESGRLGGAGLDVLPQEPALRDEAEIFRTDSATALRDLRTLVANHALLRFPNVIVTPHIAYNSREAVARIIDATLEIIEAYARGEPRNLVIG